MRENLNRSGIYLIRNTKSGKVYIGSAGNIRIRWKAHRQSLRTGRHHNIHLLNSFEKNGFGIFEWKVLEFCPSEDLTVCEQKWIDHYDSANRLKGYNLAPVAGSTRDYKHSEESRRNMSKAHVGNRHTDEAKKKIAESQCKTVYQFDLDGNLLQSFPSLVEAEAETGIFRQSISGCCRKINKSAGGYQWSFTRDSPGANAKHSTRKIEDEQGGVYCSIKEACERLNVGRNVIYKFLKNGWKFL